jgi:hypothetical protein
MGCLPLVCSRVLSHVDVQHAGFGGKINPELQTKNASVAGMAITDISVDTTTGAGGRG